MKRKKTEVDDELDRLVDVFSKLDGMQKEETQFVDDFVFTSEEERDWFEAEPDFTKRIVTPLPTKRRRRVTPSRVPSSPHRIRGPFIIVKFHRMIRLSAVTVHHLDSHSGHVTVKVAELNRDGGSFLVPTIS